MITNVVVGISGGLGSGKSTLAAELSAAIRCDRVGFGDYVRAEAHRLGLGEDREALQKLGAELKEADVEALCRNVLALGGWKLGGSVVVEGVRHVDVVNALREAVSPSRFTHVHIALGYHEREERFQKRGRDSAKILAELETHSTEHDVNKLLPSIADIIVDGTLSSSEQALQIIDQLRD